MERLARGYPLRIDTPIGRSEVIALHAAAIAVGILFAFGGAL